MILKLPFVRIKVQNVLTGFYGTFTVLYYTVIVLMKDLLVFYHFSICIFSLFLYKQKGALKSSLAYFNWIAIASKPFLERWVVCYKPISLDNCVSKNQFSLKKSKKLLNFIFWWHQQFLQMPAEVILNVKSLPNLWQTFWPSFMQISWVVT